MKQSGTVTVLCWLLPLLSLCGQTSSIDQLEKDLNQLSQQHDQVSSQTFSTLLDQLGTAMDSPSAALDLYEKAGGDIPDTAPVDSRYEHETPDEKAKRIAKDDAATRDFASIVQLHCGLIRFGILFAVKPETANLSKDWVAWLKSSATIYGSLSSSSSLKKVKLKDSVFNSYFGFNGWKEKTEQADWSVSKIPELFRKNVIDPLRDAHSPEILTDWDLYITMRSIDQPDEQTWTSQDLPFLQFERGCDDFNLLPNAGKLSVLVDLIKNNPSHPKIDEMISRARKLMQEFRGEKPATTEAPPEDPRSPSPGSHTAQPAPAADPRSPATASPAP